MDNDRYFRLQEVTALSLYFLPFQNLEAHETPTISSDRVNKLFVVTAIFVYLYS